MYTKEEEDLVKSDQRFFEEHPRRKYRVRLTNEAELLGLSSRAGSNPKLPTPPEGQICYMSVHSIRPGYRVRRLVFFFPGFDTFRFTDEISKEFFNQFLTLETIKELDKFRIE